MEEYPVAESAEEEYLDSEEDTVVEYLELGSDSEEDTVVEYLESEE